MKNILVMLILVSSSFSFAGSTSGAGLGDRKMDHLFDSTRSSDAGKTDVETLEFDLEGLSEGQIYYMGKKRSEIEFATVDKSGEDVKVHSLRPEEILNPVVVDSLKRSRQSKQWERLAIPAEADRLLNSDKFSSEMNSLKNMNKMKLGF